MYGLHLARETSYGRTFCRAIGDVRSSTRTQKRLRATQILIAKHVEDSLWHPNLVIDTDESFRFNINF